MEVLGFLRSALFLLAAPCGIAGQLDTHSDLSCMLSSTTAALQKRPRDQIGVRGERALGGEGSPPAAAAREPPCLFCGTASAAGPVSGAQREEHRIEPRLKVKWEGWGVALAWWANLFGDDADLADLVWTTKTGISVGPTPELQNLPGLGLNIARYNAGGSIGAARDGDLPGRAGDEKMGIANLVDYKRIQGFWKDWQSKDPTSGSWDWAADPNQISMLRLARERGVHTFEMFSNSPLWWMTHSKNPAGNARAEDNLQDWNIPDLAFYLAQVAKHFNDTHGIAFETISPFNEPRGNRHGCWWHSSSGNTGQEGNCMSVSQQRKVIKALYTELQTIGYGEVKIAASDENTYDMAKRTWKETDEETKYMIGQINVHGYQELQGDRVFLKERALGGMRLRMSEFCDSDRWDSGAPANGIILANVIHYDFEYLGMSSWSYWQILDETPGWGLVNFANNDEQGRWGQNKTHWRLEPKFWSLAHFTRHIREGMLILHTGYHARHGAFTVVAYSPREQKLVLVTTNFAGQREITYDLQALKAVAGPVSSWVTQHGHIRKVYQKETNGRVAPDKKLTSEFAPWSHKTFEIFGVTAW